MELTTSFTVAEPIGDVWTALTDLRLVAECLPGATVTDVGPDGTYIGTLTVQMGSINATFTGTARLEDVDHEARRVHVTAGGSSAMGDARLHLRGVAEPRGDATDVTLTSQVELTGRLAQLGHGVGGRVTERLIERMASTLERRLAGADGGADDDELGVADLVRAAVPDEVRRAARPFAAFVVAACVGWWLAGWWTRARPPVS
jgi:carbon monoxide dehydrogenase subunit G